MKTAIVDIDGTLSDARPRLHFVRPPEGVSRDYEAFHSRCGEDKPIKEMVRLVSALANDSKMIVLVTGRPDTYRDITQDWLDNNGVVYDELHMRPAGHNAPAPEFKKGVLDTLRSKGHDVFLALEDQQSVVDMWRANGIHCLQTQAVG
jgi:uncharacterized HAD superfamily protein